MILITCGSPGGSSSSSKELKNEKDSRTSEADHACLSLNNGEHALVIDQM
jgi:hypothetical protein